MRFHTGVRLLIQRRESEASGRDGQRVLDISDFFFGELRAIADQSENFSENLLFELRGQLHLLNV